MKKKELPELKEEQLGTGEEVQTQDEAYAKAIKALTDIDKPKIMTELAETEIKMISALTTIYDHFKIELGQNLIKNFELLRISTKRKGRGEILAVAKGAREEKERFARLKSFLGMSQRV